MGNHCAPCCFQKSETDSILQSNIKDAKKSGYSLENNGRGAKASSVRGGNGAGPSAKMELGGNAKKTT